MSLLPYRFLVRTLYSCPYVAEMPRDDEDCLIDLPEEAKLEAFADLDGQPQFADVRLGWNETGVGLQIVVKGKSNPLIGDPDRPRQSDGVTLWIDTRADRSGHRATRTCHQFHFLAAGGGSDRDEPMFAQTKINRALQDAPLAGPGDAPFRLERLKGGYRLEAFIGASLLTGFDPEQHPRWGLFYCVRDGDLGEQTPSVGADFPYGDDPSLWTVLELTKNG